MVTMYPVSSSNIDEIGYDATTSTLYIKFKNNRLYSYDNVPKSVYDNLKSASSIGGFFHQNIRDVYVTHKL